MRVMVMRWRWRWSGEEGEKDAGWRWGGGFLELRICKNGNEEIGGEMRR